MRIFNDITELIGKTPLVHIHTDEKTGAKVVAKVEAFNPAGSIKDRAALSMIETAEREGLLKKGGTIIEPTSGNTGIGLAAVAAVRGYKVILTMPETMSIERRKLLSAYGAEIVLTEGVKGMKGAIKKALEIKEKTPGAFIPDQFKNPANPEIHEKTTGPEIWEDTDEEVNIIVAGVGTGGTLSGTAKYLKSKNSEIKAVAVEPFESQMMGKGEAGPHKIQGIGANFVPDNFDAGICDEIVPVKSEDAKLEAKKLAAEKGILAGISAGASVHAGKILAAREENADKLIVVILPDTGERYLSEF
ncbi:MAG: cysteine synthase A [Clostridia bacterium]|nr:cysteine synthase A [Clostridia bacterium]